MPNGYAGRILHVDLTRGRLEVEHPKEEFYRRYFGGRALIAYYLLRECPPDADPLGPDNVVVFAPGVMTGTPLSGQGRNGVGARSPLTGGFGNAEAGGFFGAELKRAGFDAVVVKGRAATPVYLWVDGGEAELRDASHLWGRTTGEAEDRIREGTGEPQARTALIGPAGENLVRFASVVNDRSHVAGRTGIGAVMGSKNFKGIAVKARKDRPFVEVADKERLKAVRTWLTENLHRVAGLHDTGTAGGLRALSLAGGLPTFNFQEGSFAGADAIDGEVMRDTILVRRGTCDACAVRCKRVVEVKEPYAVDPGYGGPEYEGLSALGSNAGIDDLRALAKANEICNAQGLDVISTGAVISYAMEAFERGYLTVEQTGGLELRFGNAGAMLKVLDLLVRREGVGDLLAEGVFRAAKALGDGAEEFALHVKGQELPMHEPRIKHTLGVGYALSPTGADHMHNLHDTAVSRRGSTLRDLSSWGEEFEPQPAVGINEAKMRMYYYQTNWRHFLDSAVMCHFLPYSPQRMAEIVGAITGWSVDIDDLLAVGRRAGTLAQLFNRRVGFGPAEDSLPDRFFGPFRSTPKGEPLNREEFEWGKARFFEWMGWDETGRPRPETLEELGIADFAR